jgi:protein-S-isoprenylcysteine O-methyltransferase Ste14
MVNLFKAPNGMNIIGQGGKIILSTIPFAIAAVLIHLYLPQAVSLPSVLSIIHPAGYVLLILGFGLWLCGVIQLITLFPKGKLITNGAYGVCRNPIYSSMILFVLPAISLLTLTWIYLALALILYFWVVFFIREEEIRLQKVFGEEYSNYKANVSRVIPFVKPGSK